MVVFWVFVFVWDFVCCVGRFFVWGFVCDVLGCGTFSVWDVVCVGRCL